MERMILFMIMMMATMAQTVVPIIIVILEVLFRILFAAIPILAQAVYRVTIFLVKSVQNNPKIFMLFSGAFLILLIPSLSVYAFLERAEPIVVATSITVLVPKPTVILAPKPTNIPAPKPTITPDLTLSQAPIAQVNVQETECPPGIRDTTEPRLYYNPSDKMNNDRVVFLQRILLELDYALPTYGADGWFGVETEQAVKTFQTINKLKVDGIVGPNTWACLKSSLALKYR